MERIRHGHRVYEDHRGVVLRDDSRDEGVIDRSKPIVIRYINEGEYASVPLLDDKSTAETLSGALYLAAKFGLRIESEDGYFSVKAEERPEPETVSAEAIWVILESHCGAEGMKEDFVRHAADALRHGERFEYRFQGDLGFGGKIRINPREIRVSCYEEDLTPERQAMLDSANRALAELRRE